MEKNKKKVFENIYSYKQYINTLRLLINQLWSNMFFFTILAVGIVTKIMKYKKLVSTLFFSLQRNNSSLWLHKKLRVILRNKTFSFLTYSFNTKTKWIGNQNYAFFNTMIFFINFIYCKII